MSTQGGKPPSKQELYASATDEQLARAMAEEQGENDGAWQEFLGRYGDRIMRVIRSVGSSLDDDERKDVFQQAVFRMHGAIGRFKARGPKSLGSWAYKIAQNATYDWFREASKVEFVSVEEVGETLSVDAYDDVTPPSAQFDAAMAALERAKAKLLPRHQTILALSKANLPDREIALRLGMGVETVRKVRYKALARLRELLIEEGQGMGWI